MKYFIHKIIIPAVFFIAFSFTMIINCYEAKADVGGGIAQNVNVRSTKLESNRIIKVPNKQSEREKLSRGSSSITNRVVEYSYKFLGKPYVWAASGPSAFDCSGFTSYVYGKFGYSLPHYTGYQVQMGSSVSRSNLKSGDLVFFDTSGSDSHVGIYIGNGKFIHASSGKKQVTISDLGQSYYNLRYSAARRILD